MDITVVSDIICPWCFIGTRRLEQVLASTETATPPDVRYHAYLLDPDVPPEGADLRDRLRRKYGVDPEAMFTRIAAAAAETGITLDFSRIRRTPNTIAGHTVLRHAGERGTQRALANALFTAYFIDGRDIGDPEVLAAIAEPHGFTPEETQALVTSDEEAAATRGEAEAAGRSGIRGVPFFVFDNKLGISGAQPVHVFRQAIERSRQSAVGGPQ